MLKLLLKLCALSLGMSCIMATDASPTSQLASLNERMNKMLSAIYTSPLLSKSSTTPSASSDEEDVTSTTPETSYVVPSGQPQVVFVTPAMLETGTPPIELYPEEKHHVVRSAYPYPYEYVYPQYSTYPSYPRYPEAPRSYRQIPAAPINPQPYPSPTPYNPLYLSSLPSPVGTYPSSYSPASIPFAYSPYPQPVSYSPSPFQPQPYSSPASYPVGYPSLPSPGYPALPPSSSTPYPSSPLLYSPPSLPSPLPSGSPSPIPGQYASPVFNGPWYPSPYSSPQFSLPSFPKYSEVLHHHFDFGA